MQELILKSEPQFFEGMAWYRPAPGNGPPLLCLSGYQDTAKTFLFLDEVLGRFDPILLDWRGQGASMRRERMYTIQEAFADLIRFINIQLPQVTEGPVHILAHSMGAALAARFAGTLPERVRSLVLVEGFSGIISADAEADRLRSWAEHLTEDVERDGRSMNDIADVERVLSRIHRGVRKDRIAVLARLLARPQDPAEPDRNFVWVHDPFLKNGTVPLSFAPEISRALWRRIAVPVLLFLGKKSHLHPGPARLPEILSHFKTLELCEVDGAGHNLHHDQPEALVPEMLAFYGKHGFL